MARSAAQSQPERRISDPSAPSVAGPGVWCRHSFTPSDEPGVPASRPDRLRVRPGIRYFDRPFEGAHLHLHLHLHLNPCYEHTYEVCRLGAICLWPRSPGLAPRPTATPRRRGDHAAPSGAPRLQGFCCARAECDLLLHAPAVDLAKDEDPDRVDRVQVRRADGTSCLVRARLMVLAAGGIENQRLLRHRACRSGNARSCPPNRRWPPRWSPVRSRRNPAAWVAADEVYARTRTCAIRCAKTLARCCGCRRIDVSPNRGGRPTPPGWVARSRASTRRHRSRCRPKPSKTPDSTTGSFAPMTTPANWPTYAVQPAVPAVVNARPRECHYRRTFNSNDHELRMQYGC